MTEDPLFRELARANQERDAEDRRRLDERWDRLAAGTLTAEEDAELRALAATTDEAREAYEAFRPLGSEFQARVVAAAKTELANDGEPTDPQATRSRLLPFRRAAARVEVWFATAAAVAAASLLVLLRGPASLAPLPLYQISLSTGIQPSRGKEPAKGPPVFIPGSEMALTVRPATAVEDDVEARGYLSPSRETRDLQPWAPPPRFERSATGSFQLRGTLGRDVQLAPGAWTVWIAIGRQGKLPSASALEAELRAGRPRDMDWQAVCADLIAGQIRRAPWQVVCASLLVEDRPPQ